MPKNQFNIFEDDAAKMMAGLRKQYAKGFSDDMDRAATILQEEYYKFLNEAATKGFSGVMSEATVIVKYKRKYKNIPRVIKVYIPQKGDPDEEEGNLGNIAFNVLNSGRKALGDAHAHGLKVWPMQYPREIASGNSPMTRPNSPILQVAFSNEPRVYRRFIDKPIKARNFVKEIMARTRKRLDDENLAFVTITTTEQD